MKKELWHINQREMADGFKVSTNTLAKWRLPRVDVESNKGTEIFYDWGICMYIKWGRDLAKLRKRKKPNDLDALAVGYVLAPHVGKSFTDADTKRYLSLTVKRGGYSREKALIALGMAAHLMKVAIR